MCSSRYAQMIILFFWIALIGCSYTDSASETSVTDASTSQQEEVIDADKPDLSTWIGDDWPDFLGPNRDNISKETGLNWDWKNGALPVTWVHRLSGGYGSGTTNRGRYYHFDRFRDSARVVCLHAETGQQLWEFRYPTDYTDMYGFDNGPRCSPVIDDDRVYVFGAEGMLYCLNALTGKEIWNVDTEEEFEVVQNFFGVGSTPIVYKDMLITMVGGSPQGSRENSSRGLDTIKPNQSAIVAFDKLTGDVRYKTVDDLASYASPVITQVDGKDVCLAFCRVAFHAFNPENGEVLWSFPWRARKYESVNASTPVVDGDTVFITESYGPGGALLDISEGQPKPVWTDQGIRDQKLACHWCTPIVIDGYVYGCSGESSSTAELRCIELATGKIMWSQRGIGRNNLLYVDGHMICLCDSGSLFAFKATPEKFEVVANYRPTEGEHVLVSPCYAAPFISRGRLYVRDALRVFCFDLTKPN